MSPNEPYIPAGAEGGEYRLSSTRDEGETLEEELARYFENPSYRAADPTLLNPIEPEEEDWGDTPPVLLPMQISQGPSPPTARIQKRQRYLQQRREQRRQQEWDRDYN